MQKTDTIKLKNETDFIATEITEMNAGIRDINLGWHVNSDSFMLDLYITQEEIKAINIWFFLLVSGKEKYIFQPRQKKKKENLP